MLILAAKAAVTIVLFYLILQVLDDDALIEALRDVDLGLALSGVLAMWLNVALSAYRWQVFLGFFRLETSLATCARIYAEAVAVNLVLPGSVGGDVYRVYKLGHARGRYWEVLSSVLADRFCSLLVLLVVSAGALSLHLQAAGGPLLFVLCLLAATAAGFVFVYSFPVSRRWMDFKAYRYLVRLVHVVKRLFRGPQRIFSALGLSVAVQASVFASMYFCLAAVERDLAQVDLAILSTALATLAAMLPVTLAGFGLREGAVVATLSLLGVPIEQAAAVAAVFAVCTLGQCLPGALAWASSTLERSNEAPVRSR